MSFKDRANRIQIFFELFLPPPLQIKPLNSCHSLAQILLLCGKNFKINVSKRLSS